jgi:DNA modification methylase
MRIETVGNATLYLGDCRDVIPLLPNGSIDLVVTSPPYNQMNSMIEAQKKTTVFERFSSFQKNWEERGYEDNISEEEYQAQQNSVFTSLAIKCRDTGSLFYNHQLRWRDMNCIHPIQWFHPGNWKLRTEIIWDRAGGTMFNAKMFMRKDERIIWFVRSNSYKWIKGNENKTTIWHMPREQRKEHPVAYPLALPQRCIESVTDVGDTVLDPYMGGGTTGIACSMMNRRFIGIERDEKYFELCLRVIKQTETAHGRFNSEQKSGFIY